MIATGLMTSAMFSRVMRPYRPSMGDRVPCSDGLDMLHEAVEVLLDLDHVEDGQSYLRGDQRQMAEQQLLQEVLQQLV